MKWQILCFTLLVICPGARAFGQKIDTTAPGVLRITPEDGYVYAPVFTPFCDDVVWLGKLTWQLSTQQFLPEKSSTACIPEKARRTYFGTNPKYQRFMRWESDPFEKRYCWASEYQRDTLFLWRYDLETTRLDSFASLARGRTSADHEIGKAGFWVINEQELVLHDRYSGLIRTRAPKPIEGQLMQLRPWGEDVLVNDRWLYRRAENRYEDFFPLPEDMKGCQTHTGMSFLGTVCISSAVGGSVEDAEYLITAGAKSVRLPFKRHWNVRRYDLAVNPPIVWFSFPDKVLAFDFVSGDSMVYQGETGKPLIGNHTGRFLAFQSEKGLLFFDKNSREFRALNLPYGFKGPQNYTSDQRYIYLAYDNHWEIVDFSKLAHTFERSTILEEFAAFDQERKALQKNLPKDFYGQFEAYTGLMSKYQALNNPKIDAEWAVISNQLGNVLFEAPDSVFLRIDADYVSGRFPLPLTCDIVEALFNFWCRKTALDKALQLLKIAGNKACIEEKSQYGDYGIQLLLRTQHQLDSIETLNPPPDERLYATGAVWWEYCTSQPGFGIIWSQEAGLKKPMSCFRELLHKYPSSPWADNAAYDTLYFVDYQPQTTDDYTPAGNDNDAYHAFSQFLKDYPTSERRPDVLVRLANVIQRGVYDRHYNNIDKETADEYLHIVATEYPDFAKNSAAYQESLARQNQYQWSNRWNITLAFNQEKYRLEDSIFVTVQLQNRSGSAKILDQDFLQDWYKGLKLQVSKTVEPGCAGLWGDFPLLPVEPQDSSRAISVEPRGFYAETFMLGRKSYTKKFFPGSFELESRASYDYYLEFRHERFSWLWVAAKNRGRIQVE